MPIATVRSAAATATNAAVTSRGLVVVATILPSRSYTEPSFSASVTSNDEPPVDSATLAYAIVRLAEAFLFNDATAAMRGDVDRLREIEAALLGVSISP